MNIRISIILFLFISPVLASETTVYLGSIEKTIETGEIKIYVPAGNATVMKVPLQGKQNQARYLYSDHLGSTSLVTDELGNKTENYLYYPFGQITNYQFLITNQIPNSNFKTDKLYTGQRMDTSSDLYFYNARYYNPNIGNFISADKAQGPNRYSYVGNNPIMRNDPTGMMQTEGDGYTNADDFCNSWNIAGKCKEYYDNSFFASGGHVIRNTYDELVVTQEIPDSMKSLWYEIRDKLPVSLQNKFKLASYDLGDRRNGELGGLGGSWEYMNIGINTQLINSILNEYGNEGFDNMSYLIWHEIAHYIGFVLQTDYIEKNSRHGIYGAYGSGSEIYDAGDMSINEASKDVLLNIFHPWTDFPYSSLYSSYTNDNSPIFNKSDEFTADMIAAYFDPEGSKKYRGYDASLNFPQMEDYKKFMQYVVENIK